MKISEHRSRLGWLLVAGASAVACARAQPASDEPALALDAWYMSGPSTRFRAVADTRVAHAGRASARLEATERDTDGAGRLAQAMPADAYRGRRLRFSGYVQTDGVTGWAGLWMRVDRRRGPGAFDNMQNRPIHGTTAWTRYAVVLDVPADAVTIELGLIQDGPGASHLDDVVLDIVGPEVAVTELGAASEADSLEDPAVPWFLPGGPRTGLQNGDFEVGERSESQGRPAAPEPGHRGVDGWFLSGGASDEFEAAIDPTVHAHGNASARLRPRAVTPSGYGTLMQRIPADAFRGQRLRMRAQVQGAAITGRGDLWLRVQAVYSPGDGPGLGGRGFKLAGTFAWRPYEVVFDVPDVAEEIQLGIGLAGTGTLWLDGVTLDEVSRDVAATAIVRAAPRPTNLDFETFAPAKRSP